MEGGRWCERVGGSGEQGCALSSLRDGDGRVVCRLADRSWMVGYRDSGDDVTVKLMNTSWWYIMHGCKAHVQQLARFADEREGVGYIVGAAELRVGGEE